MGSISDELTMELRAVGCTEDFYTPNNTMGFRPESFDTAARLAELLEQMVHRRENLWRTEEDVGVEAATNSREDVALVITALQGGHREDDGQAVLVLSAQGLQGVLPSWTTRKCIR